MLCLKNLTLYQFKNYRKRNFHFAENVIGIYGDNGVGKTNLLDAIYYLCFTKSYFTKTDNNLINHGSQGMRLEGNFRRNGEPEQIVAIIRESGKKEISRNGEEYKKFSAHIGQFPTVIIAPDDVELITGSSEVRRKYLDTLLSQLDQQYLQMLISYNRVLQQRNSLLKSAADRGYVDETLLEVLNKQLVKPANYIFDFRKKFLEKYLCAVVNSYKQIASPVENLQLRYYSQLLEDDFENLLSIFKQKDLMLQRTTCGIHKDDIELKFGDELFKTVASQGQRKSLLFALKLEEFEELKFAKGFPPVLLLDDVFEKLDSRRMQNLLKYVCVESKSQVFITDTHKDRLEQALEKLDVPFQLIEI